MSRDSQEAIEPGHSQEHTKDFVKEGGFNYRNNTVFCEECSLSEIADKVGTPTYVYSERAIKNNYRAIEDAISPAPHLVCYAAKANTNGAVLATLANLDAGADIVSGGELFRTLRSGIPAQRTVFSGVGKQDFEIEEALDHDILLFNIESAEELERISQIAGAGNHRARVSIRVNPDVDPQTHPYISTGLKASKFGISFDDAWPLFHRARELPHLTPLGIDCHIGSQITEVEPFIEAGRKVVSMVKRLAASGISLRYIDLGGGLGIRYQNESPPSYEAYGHALRSVLNDALDLGLTLICEPGRSIVGDAGVLLTRVLCRKRHEGKTFLVVDAAMNDLLRPSLYDAYHHISPVSYPGPDPFDGALTPESATKAAERPDEVVDIVGPICESGDFLARDRVVPQTTAGDLLVVYSAGAYGYTMASTYNSRPRAAEVFVSGTDYALVHRRETYKDLVEGELKPAWIRPGSQR